ncbi:Cof-type HAD-IIB family hydrolase [Microbacterium sp. bgisy203]|uniref:Cof-type HAD-IIB family hydrolase n=1 Tax=Microbacterium sp. bgisy203 TaxID=3413799 RepID=UPI003D7492E8
MTGTETPSRTVFVDVDGTILEHGSVIAPSTIAAIRAARANGHLVYLCTGRAEGDIHPTVRAIGFDGAITNGGAFATIGTDLVVSHTMSRPDLDRLVAYFVAHGIHYFLQAHDHIYASPGVFAMMNEFVRLRAERRAEDLRHLGHGDTADLLDAVMTDAAERYSPLDEADLDEIAKAVFVSEASDTVSRAQEDLGDRFHVIPGSMPLPGGSNGEIGPLGVNKGAAIVEVLGHLGRSAEEAVGIGDSWNDVEMFEVCGVSVAMGNADPELQAKADRVTTGVLDDGVWNAFVALGLI